MKQPRMWSGAGVLAGVLALLGAAQMPANPAYTPYLGTWTCTRSNAGIGWTGALTVMEVPRGALDFTARRTSLGEESLHHQSTHFFVREDPQSRIWIESDPAEAFEKTGSLQPNGVIRFAAPTPGHRRFLLWVSPDDRAMNMLWYLNNTQRLTLASHVVYCTR